MCCLHNFWGECERERERWEGGGRDRAIERARWWSLLCELFIRASCNVCVCSWIQMCMLASSVRLLLYDCVAAECFQMNHMPPTSTWTEARSSLVCWKSSRRIKKSILLRSDSISRNLLPLSSPPLLFLFLVLQNMWTWQESHIVWLTFYVKQFVHCLVWLSGTETERNRETDRDRKSLTWGCLSKSRCSDVANICIRLLYARRDFFGIQVFDPETECWVVCGVGMHALSHVWKWGQILSRLYPSFLEHVFHEQKCEDYRCLVIKY